MTTCGRTNDRVAELDLFRRLRDGADPAQRERIQEELVQRYTGLVRWLAGRYYNPAVDMADLLQVGYLGLMQAIRRFDPDRGSDFVSFARPTVQGEIRRWFRDKRRWIRLPRKVQETNLALHSATEALTHELDRAPTVAELAARLAVDEELVLEAMTADDMWSPQSLDVSVLGHDAESLTLAETLGAPDDRIQTVLDRLSARPLLDALNDRDRRILYLRFFEDMTQARIAQELGLSQMHVSRLLSGVLGRLREAAIAAQRQPLAEPTVATTGR